MFPLFEEVGSNNTIFENGQGLRLGKRNVPGKARLTSVEEEKGVRWEMWRCLQCHLKSNRPFDMARSTPWRTSQGFLEYVCQLRVPVLDVEGDRRRADTWACPVRQGALYAAEEKGLVGGEASADYFLFIPLFSKISSFIVLLPQSR